MATETQTTRMTADDYLSLEDDRRCELWDGELVEMVPGPSYEHQSIAANLFRALDRHCEKKKLGIVRFAPLDVVLSEHHVLQPDVVFIAESRRKEIVKQQIVGAPDMVAEILSPSTAKRDAVQKRRAYARFGVKEYWLLDPEEQTIEVLALDGKFYSTAGVYEPGANVKSPIFPGLKLAVNDIFKD